METFLSFSYFSQVYSINLNDDLEKYMDQLTSLRQQDHQSVNEHYANFLALSFAAGAIQDASHAQLFFQSFKFPLCGSMLCDAALKCNSLKNVLECTVCHERAFNARAVSAQQSPPTPSCSNAPPTPPSFSAPSGFQRICSQPVVSTTGPTPMDLDATTTTSPVPSRRPRLTAEERQRRINNNLCIVCGAADHFRDACPHATFKRQSKSAALNAVETNMSLLVPPQDTTPAPLINSKELAYIDTANWDTDDDAEIDYGL